ncbi:hypothetical protein [Roseateles sp. BYS96W]|uniref:Uncharacterized protein n=1 Tax=Pelomonas nitida TaxID=3299027 RepID=A0ABW7G2B7_9BURK
MFIVWGKKVVRRRLGHVADFCPICRGTRAFQLVRVGLASHVYYLSFGDGELHGFERVCQDCGTTLRAEERTYASVSKAKASLKQLVATTFPSIETTLRERFELEHRILTDLRSLSSSQRRDLIRVPFLLLSPKVEERFERIHLDLQSGLGLLAGIVLFFYGMSVLPPLVQKAGYADAALVALGVASLAVIVWQYIAAGRRFMRREVLPALARGLGPLKPTDAELRLALDELRRAKHRMANRVNLAELRAQLGPAQPLAAVALGEMSSQLRP